MLKKMMYLIVLGSAIFVFMQSVWYIELQYTLAKTLSVSETLKILSTNNWNRVTGSQGLYESKTYIFNKDHSYSLNMTSDGFSEETGSWDIEEGDRGLKLVLKPYRSQSGIDPYVKFSFSRDKIFLYDDSYTEPHIYKGSIKQ